MELRETTQRLKASLRNGATSNAVDLFTTATASTRARVSGAGRRRGGPTLDEIGMRGAAWAETLVHVSSGTFTRRALLPFRARRVVITRIRDRGISLMR